MSGLSYSGRVFILGAGASVFAGYPLAKDLLSFLREEKIFEGITLEASEVLTKIQSELVALKKATRQDWDLETLLTHLSIYKNVGNVRIVKGEWGEHDQMRLTRLIADRFQWQQHKINQITWGTNPYGLTLNADAHLIADTAAKFGDLIQPGDVLISFNWDLLPETILWRTGKWSYVDGYGFSVPNVRDDIRPSETYVYKPHGSVNWMQEDEQEEVPELENMANFFSGSVPQPYQLPPKAAALDMGRKLILPTYLKDISRNNALVRTWMLAQEAVVRARTIIVAGYSLNLADHPARMMLAMGLRKNTGLEEVTVISPGPTHWPEFLQRLGVNYNLIAAPFEEWILGRKP